MTHRVIVVLSFDLPEPEDAAEVLARIDPPTLPYFAGIARLSVDPFASVVEKWLDDDDQGKRPPTHPDGRGTVQTRPPMNRAQRRHGRG